MSLAIKQYEQLKCRFVTTHDTHITQTVSSGISFHQSVMAKRRHGVLAQIVIEPTMMNRRKKRSEQQLT